MSLKLIKLDQMPQSRKPKLGRIYKKFNRRPDTGEKVFHSTWTLRFQGRDHATGTCDYKTAERQLLKLIGDSTQEKRRDALGASGVLVSDLLELVQQDYQRESRANFKTVDGQIRLHLGPKLGTRRAVQLATSDIDAYKDARRAEGAKPCTVNHELKVLRRGFNLAIRAGKLTDVLRFEFMEERNVRTGFIAPQQYQNLIQALPGYLRPLVCVAFHTGMRKGELIEMQRDQVDLKHREIRLETGTTKNDQGRVAPIYGEMPSVLSEWMKRTEQEYPDCKWLFHRDGEPIGGFRKAWRSATKKAGLDELLFHDLRRSAVRCMTRSGIPRVVAMSISGHRTESIYRRYDIVDSSDIKLAGKLLDAYMNAEIGKQTGSLSGS